MSLIPMTRTALLTLLILVFSTNIVYAQDSQTTLEMHPLNMMAIGGLYCYEYVQISNPSKLRRIYAHEFSIHEYQVSPQTLHDDVMIRCPFTSIQNMAKECEEFPGSDAWCDKFISLRNMTTSHPLYQDMLDGKLQTSIDNVYARNNKFLNSTAAYHVVDNNTPEQTNNSNTSFTNRITGNWQLTIIIILSIIMVVIIIVYAALKYINTQRNSDDRSSIANQDISEVITPDNEPIITDWD